MQGADIICTLTSSKTPILEGRWVARGAHVNLVGSSTSDAREANDELVRVCRFFVDNREGVLAQGGEFRSALAAGSIARSHIIGEIGEVLEGLVPGRLTEDDISCYKSLGLISQDLFAGQAVLEAMESAAAGENIDFCSRR